MPAEKPPAFQFYPKDFLSSDAVSLMTTEQIGAYTLLLCHSWLRPEGLPADTKSLARLARVSAARFTSKVWPGIARSFSANDHGLLYNPRMERGRHEQEMYRAERSQSGKRGAATRWGVAQPSSENGSATKEPIAKRSSSSASSSASTTAESAVVGAARVTPLSVRRRMELANEGEPVPLRWDQFREIQALSAPSFGGDLDAAYKPTLAWVHEVGAELTRTGTPRGAITNPWQFWRERAESRWCVEATTVEDRGAENIRAALRARGELA